MKRKLSHSKHTIFKKILFPVMIVVIIQILFYTIFLVHGGMLENIVENSLHIIQERVENRALYLETEMIGRLINIKDSQYSISKKISKILEREKKIIADITQDAILNKQIINETASDIVNMLHYSGATGAFLILDGPALAKDQNEETKAGFYIRDMNPNNYSINNEDLLCERGFPSAVKDLNISLDSYWKAYFDFPEGAANPDNDFFYKPLQSFALTESPENALLQLYNYGYWSNLITLSEYDAKVITYSIPLVSENGTAIGVIGVDISERYLLSMLNTSEISADGQTAYVLGIMTDDTNIKTVSAQGILYKTQFGTATEISCVKDEKYDIFQVQSAFDPSVKIYAGIQKLHLYNTNTPFEEEQWVLAALVYEKELLEFPNHVESLSYIAAIIALLLGIICITLTSRLISKPIERLAQKVKSSTPFNKMELDKIGIDEIDELTSSISHLNEQLLITASRVSKIIKMSKIPLGVFEYSTTSNVVFCSRNLYHILHWDRNKEEDDYMQRIEFEQKINKLSDYTTNELNVYKLPEIDGQTTYIRLIRQTEEDTVLACIMDISKEMAEKEKILYERDYDSLTKLYNRRAFEDYMEHLFSKDNDKLKNGAMLMWDIDNLKFVNDNFGHETGDDYISCFSDCLKQFPQQKAVSARRSGDEFFVFLYGFDSREEIQEEIDKMKKTLSTAAILLPNGEDFPIRASAGIAWYPDDSKSYEELCRNSDTAMYQAKHGKKGCICEYKNAVSP